MGQRRFHRNMAGSHVPFTARMDADRGALLVWARKSAPGYLSCRAFRRCMHCWLRLRVLTVTPRYSLVFMPALDLLAGLALVPSLGPLRRPASLAVVALAVAGLYGNAWYQAVHQPRNSNPRSAAVVTYIHQNELENKAILAPQADVPTLHYYFPAHAAARLFWPVTHCRGSRGLRCPGNSAIAAVKPSRRHGRQRWPATSYAEIARAPPRPPRCSTPGPTPRELRWGRSCNPQCSCRHR